MSQHDNQLEPMGLQPVMRDGVLCWESPDPPNQGTKEPVESEPHGEIDLNAHLDDHTYPCPKTTST